MKNIGTLVFVFIMALMLSGSAFAVETKQPQSKEKVVVAAKTAAKPQAKTAKHKQRAHKKVNAHQKQSSSNVKK